MIAFACAQVDAQDAAHGPDIVLKGHQAVVLMGMFTPDGERAITGSADESVRLWDTKTGQEIRRYRGHTGPVYCLAISGDGRTLVTGAQDNTARLWDIPQPRPILRVHSHDGSAPGLALSPDGRLLVTCGADRAVRLWETIKMSPPLAMAAAPPLDRKLAIQRTGHAGQVLVAAYRSDGNLFATADADGSIVLGSPFLDTPQGTIGQHPGGTTGLAFHANNAQLVSAGADGVVRLWQLPLSTSRELATLAAPIREMVVVGNQPAAIVALDDQAVRLVDLNSGQVARELPKAGAPVSALAVTPNLALVGIADETGRVRLLNLADGADRGAIAGHAGAVKKLVFHPDNAKLATAGADGTARLWQVPVPPVPLNGHGGPIRALAGSLSGQWIATGSDDKTVRQWAPNGQPLRAMTNHQHPVVALAVRHDDQQLASGDADGAAWLWNAADGAAQGSLLAHTGAITAMEFERNNQSLLTAGVDGMLKRWQLPLVPARPSAGHSQPVRGVAATVDGKFAVTGAADQSVRVWDLANGQAARTLGDANLVGPVNAVAISGDGALVASGGENGSLLVWNLADGVLKQRRLGTGGAILDVAFFADNKQLATLSADQTLRIFQQPEAAKELAKDGAPYQVAATSADGKRFAVAGQAGGKPAVLVRDRDNPQVIATLLGHEAAITAIAFDRSTNRLITGSADKTARVWKIDGGVAELRKQEGHPGPVLAVALADDAAIAYSSGSENVIRQWTVADGKEVRQLAGHAGVVRSMVARGGSVWSASDDGTARLFNAADGAAARAVAHGGNLRVLAVSADGAKIATGGTDKLVKLWNAADGAALVTLTGAVNEITAVAFSADGLRIATASQESVRLWQADGRSLERFDTVAVTAQGLVWSADGRGLVLCRGDGVLESQPIAARQAIALPDAQTSRVVVSPDGKMLFVGGAGKAIRVWALQDGVVTTPAPVRSLAAPQATVTSMAVDRAGSHLAAASEDKTTYVWKLPAIAGAPAGQDVAPSAKFVTAAPARDVSWSADGMWLASAGDDSLVSLWDMKSGKLAERLAGHAQQIWSVAFAGQGRTLVSAGQDLVLRTFTPAITTLVDTVPPGQVAGPPADPITHLATGVGETGWAAILASGKSVLRWKADGTPLAPLTPPAADLKTLCAARDGDRVLATNGQGQAFLWTLADGKLAATWTLALPDAPKIQAVRFHRDGSEIAVLDQANRVRAFSLAPLRLLEEIVLPTPATSIAWTGPESRQWSVIGPQPQGLVASRSLIRLWDGLEPGATAVAMVPDGSRLICGGADGKIRQWLTADGKLERTLEGHQGPVTDLAVSANGQQLWSTSLDKTLRQWNLADGKLARTIPQPAAVLSVSITADNLRVLTSSEDGVARVWDAVSGLSLQTFAGHQPGGLVARWQADNQTLVSASRDKTVRQWKTSIVRSIAAHEKQILDLVLFNGGAQAITCSMDGRVVASDVNSGQVVRVYEGNKTPVRVLAMRPDNQRLAAGTDDGQVLIWNTANGALLETLEVANHDAEGRATPRPITALAWSGDNLKLAVASVPAPAVAAAAASAAAGKAAVSQDPATSPDLRVYGPPLPPLNSQPGQELILHQRSPVDSPITRVAFDRENRAMWATQENGQLALWSYASPTFVRQFNHGGPVYSAVISRDGSTVVTGSADQTVRIWDAKTGQQRAQMAGHAAAVHALALTPDESMIVSSGADRTVRLWDATGGRQLKQLVTTEETMYTVAVHPDGQRIAAAGADRIVYMFNLLTGALERKLEGHPDYIHCVAFNAKGTRLLSYGYAGQLKTWNPADGKLLFEQRIGRVGNFAHYATDDTRVLLSNGDATARVFELPQAAR